MGTEAKWNNETITDARLNEMTHLVGTTTERDASVAWPVDMLWWDTDLKILFHNDGTAAVPVSRAIGVVDNGAGFPTANLNLYQQFFDTTTKKWGLLTNKSPITWSGSLGIIFLSDDFTTYSDQAAFDAAWVSSNTAEFRGNPSNNEVDYDVPNATAPDQTTIVFDLGNKISDTEWVLRIPIQFDTWTQGSNGNNLHFGLGIGSNDESVTPETATHDFLGVIHVIDNAINTWNLFDANSAIISNPPIDTDLTHNGAAETLYIELKRKSATSYSVSFSNGNEYDGDVQAETTGTCPATIQNLRYITVYCWTQHTLQDHDIIGNVIAPLEFRDNTSTF